ncbi:MAG: hypothetical protein U5J83_14555 [Bryobacterales bacterium]|nr:hypothetical protein [Bryobacterales bacterium]
MNEPSYFSTQLRRQFLQRTLTGIGTLALAELLGAGEQDPLAPRRRTLPRRRRT